MVLRVQSALRRLGLRGAAFAGADPNLSYLIRIPFTRGLLWVPVRGRPTLFTNLLEGCSPRSLEVCRTLKPWEALLARIPRRARVGIVAAQLSYADARRLQKRARLTDIGAVMRTLRAAKAPWELTQIRKACRLTDRLFREALAAWPFRTEGALKAFLKARTMALGADLAFEPIVASGRHGAIPHWEGDGPIRRGFLVLDFGVRFRGYCADETRTVFVGRPTIREKALYEAVAAAQARGVALCRPGILARDVDAAVRQALGIREKYFTHGTGHGLGVEVHEAPTLNRASKDRLAAGMVVTIEPGYYCGLGIRTEDTVLVASRPRRLTRIPRRLRCLRLPGAAATRTFK